MLNGQGFFVLIFFRRESTGGFGGRGNSIRGNSNRGSGGNRGGSRGGNRGSRGGRSRGSGRRGGGGRKPAPSKDDLDKELDSYIESVRVKPLNISCNLLMYFFTSIKLELKIQYFLITIWKIFAFL